jgi:hypothetical protein
MRTFFSVHFHYLSLERGLIPQPPCSMAPVLAGCRLSHISLILLISFDWLCLSESCQVKLYYDRRLVGGGFFFLVSPAQPFSVLSPTGLINIFYCLYFWDSYNLEGHVPVSISPENRVTQLYPGHWVYLINLHITAWYIYSLYIYIYNTCIRPLLGQAPYNRLKGLTQDIEQLLQLIAYTAQIAERCHAKLLCSFDPFYVLVKTPFWKCISVVVMQWSGKQ